MPCLASALGWGSRGATLRPTGRSAEKLSLFEDFRVGLSVGRGKQGEGSGCLVKSPEHTEVGLSENKGSSSDNFLLPFLRSLLLLASMITQSFASGIT